MNIMTIIIKKMTEIYTQYDNEEGQEENDYNKPSISTEQYYGQQIVRRYRLLLSKMAGNKLKLLVNKHIINHK